MEYEYLIGVSFFEEENMDVSSVAIIAVPSNRCIHDRILRASTCRKTKNGRI